MTTTPAAAHAELRAGEPRLKALLRRSLDDGDTGAYRLFLSLTTVLLRRYVERHLRRTGRNCSDAEDIVQEALLAIHTKRHTYDGQVPVTAWLHAIARYKLIDFMRSAGRAPGKSSLSEVEDLPGHDGASVEARILARELMAALPARLRTPIEMTKMEGLSVAEAATRTGLSEASVKVNVHRGLKAMARIFQRPA